MNFQINEKDALALINRRERNKKIALIVAGAAVLVVIGVVLALMRQGRAFSDMKKTLDCHYEVHVHDSSCYDEEGNLICGLADYVAHTHDESCYNEDGELVCSLPEIIPHQHDDSCYIERLVLVCGCEEGQVVDSQGNPVFDAEGNPVYDIADVPTITGISVEGEVAEGEEATDAEEADAEETDADAEEADAEETDADAEEADTEETDADAEEADAEETDADTEEADAEETDANVEEADAEETDANAEEADAEETDANAEEADAEETDAIVVETEATDTESSDAVDTEETAPSTDEVITETVEIIQNADGDAEEYSYHTHTAECYVIEKELICTQQTLHVHTADCYDENGKLICGQLQLVAHVHGEECFTYVEGEIEEFTQEVYTENFKVTAKYDSRAEIPEDAVLVVTEISRESDYETFTEYEEKAKEFSGDDNTETDFMLDIYFMANGEKIEPNDFVTITVNLFDHDEYEVGHQFNLTHFSDDGSIETLSTTPLDENGSTSFSTDSFCVMLWNSPSNRGKEGYLEAGVDGFIVRLSFGADARIDPDKDRLVVSKVTDQNVINALKNSWNNNASVDFLLKFAIMNGDDVIIPTDGIRFTVTVPDGYGLKSSGSGSAVIEYFSYQNNQFEHNVISNSYTNRVFSSPEYSSVWFKNSDYHYIAGWTRINPGKYGNRLFAYRYDDNTFTDPNSAYYSFYKPSNELGIAGNFHLVAFDTVVINSDMNGNVLARKLRYESGADWGTRQYSYELSYIQDYDYPTARPERLQDVSGRHILVLGDSNEVTIGGNGDRLVINGTQLDDAVSADKPVDVVLETDTVNHPFIDIDAVEEEVKDYQNTWANVTLSSKEIACYKTYQDDRITVHLESEGGASYIRMTADELQHLVGITGFDTNGVTSLVVNVDCTGYPVSDNNQIDLGGGEIKLYDLNGKQFSYTSETGTFECGKVVYNFVNYTKNAKGEITGVDAKNNPAKVSVKTGTFNGMVVIPDGRAFVGGSTCGTIIADYIKVNCESHRTDFTGTTVPVYASIRAYKNVDGCQISVNDLKFRIEEIGGDGYVDTAETVQNGVVSFKDIKFPDKKSLAGKTVAHYYSIYELETDVNKYLFDKSIYVMKLNVKYDNNGQPSIDSKSYYAVTDTENYIVNGELNFGAINEFKEGNLEFTVNDVVFNNPTYTEIPVEKRWVVDDPEIGEEVELTKDLPYSITYNLYRVKGNAASYTEKDLINTHKVIYSENDDSWNYTFDVDSKGYKLTKSDSKGILYKYFVSEVAVTKMVDGEEIDVTNQYLVFYSQNAPYEAGVTQVITNKSYPNEYTDIEVEKKFFFESLESELISTDYKGKVVFELWQVGTVKGSDEPVSNKLYDTYEVTNGITDGDNWKLEIKQLPKKIHAIANGSFQEVEYSYYIKEISCEVYSAEDTENEHRLLFALDTRPEIKPDETETTDRILKFFINNSYTDNTYVEIDKKWLSSNPEVPSTLQTENDSKVLINVSLMMNGDVVGQYVIGVKSAAVKENTNTIYTSVGTVFNENWTAVINDLPKYSYDKENKKLILNQYEVVEGDIEETSLSYVQYGEVVKNELINENDNKAYIQFILSNKLEESFSLPETGGTGRSIIPIYIAGVVVILSILALLVYRKKLRKN